MAPVPPVVEVDLRIADHVVDAEVRVVDVVDAVVAVARAVGGRAVVAVVGVVVPVVTVVVHRDAAGEPEQRTEAERLDRVRSSHRGSPSRALAGSRAARGALGSPGLWWRAGEGDGLPQTFIRTGRSGPRHGPRAGQAARQAARPLRIR